MMARRVSAVLIALAVLVLGGWLHKQLPQANDRIFAPFTYEQAAPGFGSVGEPTVTSASSINGVASHGLWLIVEVPFTQDTANVLPRTTLHATDARSFAASSSLTGSCDVLYNQVQTTCRFVFEVPADAVEGARLTMDPGYQQMAPTLDIDLGITAERAAELTENPQPREIAEVQV